MWDNTIPVCVAAKPTLAIKKNIAVPEIINGTIIGEINNAINAALYGMCLLLKPRAATVPRIVDPIVAKKGIKIGVLEQAIVDAVEAEQSKTTKEINVTFIKNKKEDDDDNS